VVAGRDFHDACGLAAFSDKLSRSPSIFDKDRLKYYNKTAIAGTDAQSLIRLLSLSAPGAEEERLKEAVEAVKTNAEKLSDLKTLVAPFIGEPVPDEEARKALGDGAANILELGYRVEEAGQLTGIVWRDNAREKDRAKYAAFALRARSLAQPPAELVNIQAP
jgi:hypothetical protein